MSLIRNIIRHPSRLWRKPVTAARYKRMNGDGGGCGCESCTV